MSTSTASTTNDSHKVIEIDGLSSINSVAFLQDKHRIIGGGDEGMLRYWEVQDGRTVGASSCGGEVLAFALSKDGRYIVCGAKSGLVTVWDAMAQNKVVELKGHSHWVVAVDVSPDSRAFGTASYDGAATIWDIASGQLLVGPLQPSSVALVTLKFSTDGSRVATSPYSQRSVRIHDVQNGRMLLNIPVQLSSCGNEPTVPLAWSSNDRQVFVVSQDGNIQCFDASTGSLLSKWPIHNNKIPASIVLSNSEKFIVTSAGSSISFWDTVTHSQLGPVVTHDGSVQSIALSSDDNWLVSGGRSGKKIVVWSLQNILPEPYRLTSASNLTAALLHLSRPVCELWMQDQWMNAEIAITEEMQRSSSSSTNHYALANRALIRTRLQDWDSAYNDAQQSLKVQPSVVGYIAKAMACIGKGESQTGIRTFDLAFMHCSREEGPLLLLMRSIILFETGEREDAMSRVQDLIETVDDKSIFCMVQAQMLVRLGNKFIEEGDYEGAIMSFKRAQPQLMSQPNSHLKTISLIFGWKFDGLSLSVRRQLCEALHATGQMKEAAKALLETIDTLNENVGETEETTQWIAEFTRSCVAAFESMGDAATHSQIHDEAIEQYSIALSLNPPNSQGLYVKRSKARAIKGLWGDALSDANEAITHDPESPWGYERQHAALHGLRQFDEAINAFTSMLSAIENSLDQGIRQRRNNYVSPSLTVAAVDAAIQETSKTCPLVLIDTKTGLLRDESERTRIFKADPRFKELVSSMTEEVDKSRIQQVVSGFFRYVMLSHTWEGEEPSFQEVNAAKSVWVLSASPLNDKLRKFCEMVRDNGYRWAWSDTCCINKNTSTLLSRSLVSMYQWYAESAATFVLLVGVGSRSLPGDLANSLWMTRAWTLLELLAPKVIRFYDSEWEPYLGDTQTNHKESPGIVHELANALGVAPDIITHFHPGLLGAREVFRLASTRSATIEEDVVYSLIGILTSAITPNYGEGEAALGHLLEEVLTHSGGTTLLAWTGKSSDFNSCFPASTAVYKQSLYVPPTLNEDQIEAITALRTTLSQQEAMTIYDRITRLPPTIGAHRRLHLPCVVYPVKRLLRHQGDRYYAKTSALGEVEFQTGDPIPLTEPRKLYVIHPWIDGLLDRTVTIGELTWEDDSESELDSDSDVDFAVDMDSSVVNSAPMIISRERSSNLPSLSSVASKLGRSDDYTRALRLIARLEQPFSALLLQQTSGGKFRRVAAEHEILARPRQIACARDVQTAVLEVI